MLAETLVGTTCLSQARNPFCVIKTKSLEDPLLAEPEIQIQRAPTGVRAAKGISLRHR